MHEIDWSDIRVFLEVVRAGSVTHAASRLGVNHTTVSRRVSALEARLGKPLFDRTGKGWVITPVAEKIVDLAEAMAEDVHNIERQVLADSQELSGLLRVTASDHCMEQLLMPTVRRFIQRYPRVNLEIIATADEVDLASREADVALRGTNTPPPNLIGTRIANIGFGIYATGELAARVQTNPDDVPCITWVGDGKTRPGWIEKNFPKTQQIYRATSFSAMISMARQGIGLVSIASIIGESEPNLQHIPVSNVETGPDLWVFSHVDLRTTARVRVFKTYLVEDLLRQKERIEGV